ncbi:MAG: FAD-dependent oxidoreductase [Spirochaetes bacterium]|nr:FAD-dependent oxidoreductase [Spirochaetota bacterium]
MKTFDYTKKGLRLQEGWDVIIAGGGTAGAVAAISCGMEGLRTLLIEAQGALGGEQTLGLATPIPPSQVAGDRLSSAIDMEIRARTHARLPLEALGAEASRRFDPVALAGLLEEMALEHEVELFYLTSLIDVRREGERVHSLVLHNRDGLFAAAAPRFIDATGDAELAFRAGVPCESGDAEGWNPSASLRFEMSGVDLGRFGDWLEGTGQKMLTRYPKLHWDMASPAASPALKQLLLEECAAGHLSRSDFARLKFWAVAGKPGTLNFSGPEHGREREAARAKSVSLKLTEGRRAIARLANFLRRAVPGFEEACVAQVAVLPGIPESRRIQARRRLVAEDLAAFRKFPDGIATSNLPMEAPGERSAAPVAGVPIPEKYWEIPFGALVPVGLDNLLVAGRCAGFDFAAQSAARAQHTCRAMGEAAGIAVRLCQDDGLPFPALDGARVRERMRRRGAPL